MTAARGRQRPGHRRPTHRADVPASSARSPCPAPVSAVRSPPGPPLSSLDTPAPARWRRRSHAGRAVRSWVLASTLPGPSPLTWAEAQACPTGMGPWPSALSRERRLVCPSRTTRPWLRSARVCIQATQAWRRHAGSRTAKTRPHVSWDDIPGARASHSARQAALAFPQGAIAPQGCAPQSGASIVTGRIVARACSVVGCGRRGSWPTAQKAHSGASAGGRAMEPSSSGVSARNKSAVAYQRLGYSNGTPIS